MALATYTDLKAAVADLLHRTDLTTQIVDFIALAESKINRTLRARLMEVDETVTLAIGTRTIALPARFYEPVSLDLVITGQGNTSLIPLLPEQMAVNDSALAKSRPQYYAINGDNITFPNLSDATYSLLFRMVKGYAIATTSTNTLLTNHPEVYLYGAAMYAAPYIKDDKRIPTWKTYFGEALEEIKRIDARTKSAVGLRTELGGGGRQNIITGA